MRLSEVPTPALTVELGAFERNLARMHDFFRDRACNVRPHVKAHKTPAIAEQQRAAGGVGFTCATVYEAEVFANHGFDDFLIANEILDGVKIERLRTLKERVALIVAVDSEASVDALSATGLDVLIDINVGMPRCGVLPAGALDVARAAEKTGLNVRGVMGYEGHVTVMEDVAKRADATRKAMDVLLGVASELRDAGFDMGIVSGGATLTYDVTGAIDGITEVQAGSYVLMDTTFSRSSPFEEALGCITTVLAVHDNIAVLDAGLKTLSVDHGNPELPSDVSADILYLSDEHTSLVVRDGFDAKPGDRVFLRPSHVDPTVNLHDVLYAFRGEEVEDVWNVAARGYGRP